MTSSDPSQRPSARRLAGRLRALARRVPAPLLAILAVALVVELTWSLVQPPWQSPDEQVHFAYAQELAADGALVGDEDKRGLSTDHGLALQATDLNGIAFHAQVPGIWSPQLVERWREEQAALPPAARHDGGGPNPATPNPPLYYSLLAPAYWAGGATGGTVVDRMYLMRIASGLLLLVAVAATWLLAGELFNRNRLLQALAAGVVALQPQATFLSAMTNPDALLIALWSLGAWLGVRLLRRGLTLRGGGALALVGAAAVLTKATGYALLIAVLGVLALAAWRARRDGAPRWLRTAAVCGALAVVPALGWVAAARVLDRPAVNQVQTSVPAVTPLTMDYGDFARYLKRFYLPEVSLRAVADGQVGYLWVEGAWGRFGFVDVELPETVRGLLKVLSALALAGGLAFVLTRRRRIDAAIPLYLAGMALLLLGALHYADFQLLVSAEQSGAPPPAFMQGRYILPLVGILACTAAAAVALLPGRLRGATTGTVLGGMWCLQLLSLTLVLERYFA